MNEKQLMIATLASGMALSGVSMSGCTTDPATGQQTMNKTAIGALAGAAAGAVFLKPLVAMKQVVMLPSVQRWVQALVTTCNVKSSNYNSKWRVLV